MSRKKETEKEWLHTLGLSFAFAGGFLGAGFVSGRELWQFFGRFGWKGFLGFLFTGALFGVIGWLIMNTGLLLHTTQVGNIVAERQRLYLRKGIEVLQGTFLFAVATIMLAAGAALLKQICALPLWAGGLLILLLVVGIGGSGLHGLISFFSSLVPLILLFSIVTALLAMRCFGFSREAFVATSLDTNPLLSSWWLAALSYTSYNVLGTMGLQASLIQEGRNKRQLFRAIIFGVIFLMLMAFGMLLALFTQPEVTFSELPMLELACQVHPIFGKIFGFILLGGMLGACLTSLVILTDLLADLTHGDKKKILSGLGLLCFAGSFLGFGSLVAVVYPLFGYVGFLVIGCLAVHGIHLMRHPEDAEKEKIRNRNRKESEG